MKELLKCNAKVKCSVYKDLKSKIQEQLKIDKSKTISFEDLETLLINIENKHNTNNKLRILVDMDGVLVQDLKYAIKLYNKEYGANLKINDFKGWDIENYVPEGTSILRYFYETGFFDKLEPMPHSKRILKKLFDEGHEIIIATASPPIGVFDKSLSLKKHFPWLPESNFVPITKKHLLCADVILDDAIHNLVNANVEYPVMFYAHHNKDNHDFYKVNNWLEFYDFIQEIVTKRKEHTS